MIIRDKMKKLLKLSKFLVSIGLKDESHQIYKIAQSLPPGASIEPDPYGSGFMTPALTEPLLRKNLDLKKIFEDHHDDSFFKSFTYIHYFRGVDGKAEQFVRDYGMGSGGNPMELSVVGAPNISPCSLMNQTESKIGDSTSFALVLEGTPTSAFYYDATSSYFGQMVSPPWLETLTNVGINPDEYNPKVTALPAGRLESFFYNQESYNKVAELSRNSDYHEVFLKNAKVKYVIITKRMDKDMVREFLEEVDPYWLGESPRKKIDVIICSGSSAITGPAAINTIMEWVVSPFVTGSNNVTKLDLETFDKIYLTSGANSSYEESFRKKRNGINLLKESITNDSIEEGSVFAGMAYAMKDKGAYGDTLRDSDIKDFMDKYLMLSFIDIGALGRMWGEYFGGADKAGPKIGFSMSDTMDNYNIVTKMTKPVFEKIINDIKININSSQKSPKSKGINLFTDLLNFLGDTGQFVYRRNLRKDPKAFEYFLEMLAVTKGIAEDIFNNENLREMMANDVGISPIADVNDLQEISVDGAKLSETIVNIYRTSVEHTNDEIEEQLEISNQAMQSRRERVGNY